jgi:hypothetical protein
MIELFSVMNNFAGFERTMPSNTGTVPARGEFFKKNASKQHEFRLLGTVLVLSLSLSLS